jgi:phosphoglycolate phosphatase
MHCAFDFDGTLADSKSIYYKAIQVYSHQKGLKIPVKSDMDIVFGHPNPPIVFEGWGKLEGFTDHLHAIYFMTDDLICNQPSDMPLYPKITEMLEDLSQDFTLSIVTSRSIKPIRALLDYHEIGTFFKTIRSDQDVIDRGYRKKPHPDKLNCVLRELACPAERSVMIGDTLMDMAMAKNAGTKAVGVSWGYHNEATLRDHGADAVVDTPQKLSPEIRFIFKS